MLRFVTSLFLPGAQEGRLEVNINQQIDILGMSLSVQKEGIAKGDFEAIHDLGTEKEE
jgi:hypothetical protein